MPEQRAERPCTSLRALAQERRLPAHQLMDHVTLRWISSNRPANFDAEAIFPRPGLMLIPPASWFAVARGPESTHGIGHNARVSLLAGLLAQDYGLDDDAVAAACAAGAAHDCRRYHDRADPGHGQRAAAWFLAHGEMITTALGRRLPAALMSQAATAIALHDVPYEQFTRVQQRIHQAAPHLVDLLKAADCLDRYRLPLKRWWPDTSRLHIPVPRWLPAAAFALVVRTEQARLDGATHRDALTTAHQKLTRGQ